MVVLLDDCQAHAIPDGKVARQAGELLKRQLAPAVGWENADCFGYPESSV